MTLLGYAITSNHTHLLLHAEEPEEIAALMQLIEGASAQGYNVRKRRRGAFWDDRYHLTMIECLQFSGLDELRTWYADTMTHALEQFRHRDPKWTESIAVGSEAFVRGIAPRLRNRALPQVEHVGTGSASAWIVREPPPPPYSPFSAPENASNP